MLKPLDKPPFWLLAFVLLAWGQARFLPLGLSLDHPVTDFVGGILVGGGLILIALAVVELRRAKTTLNPHGEASAMVTTGIFKRSRNPIYLGGVFLLLGLVLGLDAVAALPLVPIFFWVLETRFVVPEENFLRGRFRADFARYCQKTRRWV